MAGLSRLASLLRILVACALLALAACSGTARDSMYGTWRAVLPVAGGDLPFGLEIARQQGRDVAWLINGPERAQVTDVTIDGDRISMGMPGYAHRLDARLAAGRLEGEVIFLRPGGEHKAVRMIAERGLGWRFFPGSAGENANFSGRWMLSFRDPDSGAESTGIAELTQQGRVVTGTVLRESGDDRYIAGEARGDMVFLSRFDGGSAFLYVGRLNESGELEGEFRSALGTFRIMAGRRDAAARLADVTTLTQLRADAGPVQFSFPDADGRSVSLADEQFRDKVVIVTMGGTWCPNCHDEATFLQEFLPPRRDRGLEIVQLMFEYTDDFASAAASVRRFTDEFAIGYPVLIAGSYESGAAQRAIPQLEKFYAYPTMLVLDRSGRIRYTHTGFSGPATGMHYEEFRREFSAVIDGLLSEKGPGAARRPSPQRPAPSRGA